MNKKICVVSCFLIIKFCFSSSLQISDSGLYISKDIFFRIAEYIVPNLLIPTHPKEIAYQDRELKKYRLVCKKWRELLDQRVNFDAMNILFVQMYDWNNQKFFNYYKERLDVLINSYIQKNKWFIEQYDLIKNNIEQKMNNEENRVLSYNEKEIQEFLMLSSACKAYRKVMKKQFTLYGYNALLMLEKYVYDGGFLNTYSLIRLISYFYFYLEHNADQKKSNLLKKLTLSCDLTDVFSRLFKRVILNNEPGRISYLKEAPTINYRRFVYNIYVSFAERRTNYSFWIVSCSSKSFISEFFNFYSNVFSLKDSCHKYFLYYLLLYSKNCFFNIQLILLIDFIRGIKKQFVDYPESDRIEYKNLLEKNFLAREDRMCSGDSVFLKNYFGIPFI